MIHSNDAIIAFMFDMAGGAVLCSGVELGRLLVPEIGTHVAGQAGLRLNSGDGSMA